MALSFILNPAASHGRAGRLRSRLEGIAERLGVPYEVHVTREPGHATLLARELAVSESTVVAVGGDGTVQEVAAGLVGTNTALGVVPIGTGNDYARSLGLPTKLDAALRMIPFLRAQPTDLGRASWTNADGDESSRVYVNALGTGFDAYVAVLSEQYKQLPGQAAYLAGVFKGLRTWTNPTVEITTAQTHPAVPVAGDASPMGEPVEPRASATEASSWFDGPMFLLAVGNGSSVGGGFRITPDANPSDGVFDVCLLRGITSGRALQLLPRAMRGKHVSAPEVEIRRVTSITLRSETPLPVHADGEILSTSAVRLTTTIEPGVLQVLRP